jgi:hypothetical protein
MLNREGRVDSLELPESNLAPTLYVVSKPSGHRTRSYE